MLTLLFFECLEHSPIISIYFMLSKCNKIHDIYPRMNMKLYSTLNELYSFCKWRRLRAQYGTAQPQSVCLFLPLPLPPSASFCLHVHIARRNRRCEAESHAATPPPPPSLHCPAVSFYLNSQSTLRLCPQINSLRKDGF